MTGKALGSTAFLQQFLQFPASSAVAFQASGWGNTSRAGQSMICHPPMVARLFKASTYAR